MTLALGGMTRDEMMFRMSSREFAGWMAYYSIEPFGPARDDMHSARQQHTQVLCHWASKTEKPPPVADFLVVRPPRPVMDGDMLLAAAKMATAALAPLKKMKKD